MYIVLNFLLHIITHIFRSITNNKYDKTIIKHPVYSMYDTLHLYIWNPHEVLTIMIIEAMRDNALSLQAITYEKAASDFYCECLFRASHFFFANA